MWWIVLFIFLFVGGYIADRVRWNGGNCEYCENGCFDEVSNHWLKGKLYKCYDCGQKVRLFFYRRF